MYDKLAILGGAMLMIVLIGTVGWFSKRIVRVSSKNTPVLFNYYTLRGMFLNLKKIKGKNYDAFIYKTFNLGDKGNSAVILLVNLNFKTNLHLIAISNEQSFPNILMANINNHIEEVDLEGDYSNYFKLYSEKDSQAQARYIIDPAAMAFTADFCKSHSWEIVDSCFYFVQDNFTNTPGDNSVILENVERFIEEIKPALITPLTAEEIRLRKAYGSTTLSKENIKCPVCSQVLVETFEDVYECSGRHGTLLHASDLIKLRNKKLILKYNSDKVVGSLAVSIDCPSCKNPMHKVNYAMTKTIIDACNICYFRWIDSGELLPTTARS